jgi:DNA-binding MarR family transcriptional regulator
MLLTIRGLPPGAISTIGTLAERLALKHHSAVELIDRLQARGLVRRVRSEADRRAVRVVLTPRGQRILEQVAQRRLSELQSGGAALAEAINLLVHNRSSRRDPARRKNVSKKNSDLSK